MSDEKAQKAEIKPSEQPPSSQENAGGKPEAWGYDLYPERRGTFKPSLTNVIIGKEGKENMEKYKCEKNVFECVKDSKLKLVLSLKCSRCACIHSFSIK